MAKLERQPAFRGFDKNAMQFWHELAAEMSKDWFVANKAAIAYAAYFDVDGLWPTQIDTGRFPNSASLFRKLFAG